MFLFILSALSTVCSIGCIAISICEKDKRGFILWFMLAWINIIGLMQTGVEFFG